MLTSSQISKFGSIMVEIYSGLQILVIIGGFEL